MDYNATAPLRVEALAAMGRAVGNGGNPASLHRRGRQARKQVDAARDAVRKLVGTSDTSNTNVVDVVFTASGTEADALAVLGIARARRRSVGASTVVISAFEHPAVVESSLRLAAEGFDVRVVLGGADGRLDVDAMAAVLDPGVALVSVMLANNETGVLQPVAEVAQLTAVHGIPLHTDAVQAAGKIPIGFDDLGVQALSLSAHKFGGPRGIGALVVQRSTTVMPLWRGGEQEGGLRSGTPACLLAAGLDAAAGAALDGMNRLDELRSLRDRIESGLREVEGVHFAVQHDQRLPNTASVGFKGIPSHTFVDQLSARGLMVSGGAACHADRVEPSAVLRAMGVPRARALEMLRLSLGWGSTVEEVDSAVRIISGAVATARIH
ncbi:MAG: cysteine desulfurase family protein [Myxococcota bacterium]